ncbi:hypothetical protein HDU84_000766, partial [Entophlyctis sp. JEL0112]
MKTCAYVGIIPIGGLLKLAPHMTESGEDNDMEWSDDEDILNNSVLIARTRVEEFFDGSQVGKSLAKLITHDTLVDILEGEN